MKTVSNIPLPVAPRRWKDGEYGIYINHKDNGYLPTDDPETDKSSRRYEADFTIVKELTAESAILAFTRQAQDPVLDQKVIDTIEVDGGSALDVPLNYVTKVSTTIFPALPSSGRLLKGQIFSYNNGAIMVVQDHDRTIYAPELTPALFSFYRENPEGKEWIPGEQVALNATRTYKGKTYKCIQAHQTQESWNPELTVGTLWQVIPTSSEWKAGVAYKVGDKVTYLGKTYQCLQAHTSISTWYPSVVP
ncbi:MAG TPA: hypothetical protein PK816_14015, partial [Candidatus Cloacimonadota bacterium]|nr:hypothetical protein [Candidatus Cloacimonadota bacterium]